MNIAPQILEIVRLIIRGAGVRTLYSNSYKTCSTVKINAEKDHKKKMIKEIEDFAKQYKLDIKVSFKAATEWSLPSIIVRVPKYHEEIVSLKPYQKKYGLGEFKPAPKTKKEPAPLTEDELRAVALFKQLNTMCEKLGLPTYAQLADDAEHGYRVRNLFGNKRRRLINIAKRVK